MIARRQRDTAASFVDRLRWAAALVPMLLGPSALASLDADDVDRREVVRDATVSPDASLDALAGALALVDRVEAGALRLASDGTDIAALVGVVGERTAQDLLREALAMRGMVDDAEAALNDAMRGITPSDDARLTAMTQRAESVLESLLPLRRARAELLILALTPDGRPDRPRASETITSLHELDATNAWTEAERAILLADALIRDGRPDAALDSLFDARAAIGSDPRLADPSLRLTLQVAGLSVLATLSSAGPDAALRARDAVGGRPPFVPADRAVRAEHDPFARLLLADLNARIELSRLDAAGGFTNARPEFRRRALDRIASGYRALLDEAGIESHREALRALVYRRLHRVLPSRVGDDEVPVLFALARIADLERRIGTEREPERLESLAVEIASRLSTLAERADDEARSIRADVIFDLAAAEHRLGRPAEAAQRLIEFVRSGSVEDERAATALGRAMALAAEGGDRDAFLTAARLVHRAPFEVANRDALRVWYLQSLLDGTAYVAEPSPGLQGNADAPPEGAPPDYDLAAFFQAYLNEAPDIVAAIDSAGSSALALREAIVSADAWAVAFAERFPERISTLSVNVEQVADGADRRATDLLTLQPREGERTLASIDRARALLHRARVARLRSRPLDALADVSSATTIIDTLDEPPTSLERELAAITIPAAAEARRYFAADEALDRGIASRVSRDRLAPLIGAIHRASRIDLAEADRVFPASCAESAEARRAGERSSWLVERYEFLERAASRVSPDHADWIASIRFDLAHAGVLACDPETALRALSAPGVAQPPSIPATLLLGEAHLLAGDDPNAFAAFRAAIAALDADPDRAADPDLWHAWTRAVEILERNAPADASGRRLASVARQIRRLRLRDGYNACIACRERIEAAADRLGIDDNLPTDPSE